jgi:hypothetical protein
MKEGKFVSVVAHLFCLFFSFFSIYRQPSQHNSSLLLTGTQQKEVFSFRYSLNVINETIALFQK